MYEVDNFIVQSETDSNGNTLTLTFGKTTYKASKCKKEGPAWTDSVDLGDEYGQIDVSISCKMVHSAYHLDTTMTKTDRRDYCDFFAVENEIQATGQCLPTTSQKKSKKSSTTTTTTTTTCSCASNCEMTTLNDVVSFADETTEISGDDGTVINLYTKQSFSITGTVQDGKIRLVYFYGTKMAAPRNCQKVGQTFEQKHTWNSGDTLDAVFACAKDSINWYYTMSLAKNDVVVDGTDDTFYMIEKAEKSTGYCVKGI